MSGLVDTTGTKGVQIKDAILLKRAGHESEPIIRLHREDKFEYINVNGFGNMAPMFNEVTMAMNVIRMHLIPNYELYRTTIAEFAGEEKDFHGMVQLSGHDQYGISITDVIIFKISPYDPRGPFELIPENRTAIDNCVILTEKRIKMTPLSCQMGVQLLREIDARESPK